MSRLKARRSRYRLTNRLAGSLPAAIIVVLLVLTIGGTSLFASKVISFLNHVTGGVSISTITQAVGITEPPIGSIAYRLKHKEPVPINILVLGYGGTENDAPYLTDTIMAVRLDPASGRVAMISVPRDLYVSIAAWPDSARITDKEKINAAFEYGTDESKVIDNSLKKADYRGRDGGGHLAEDTVGKVTGLHFDRYVAIDFKAFRQLVDALGGVDVCLTTNLDDYNYPASGGGLIRGGIHYKAGCQHVNGAQALQLSRSREAIQSEQNTDFGRAKRQQQIIASIKKQALSADGLSKGIQLMGALNDNFKTDLTVDDISAIYNWSKTIDDSATLHYALSDTNLLTTGGCGAPAGIYSLCANDPSYQMIQGWVAQTFPPPSVLASKAPVQVAWGGSPYSLADGVTDMLKPYGFQVGVPIRPRANNATTVIYDFSSGQYPDTSAWLAQYFNATVITPTAATPAPKYIPANQGFVVYLGHDYGIRWYNLAQG
jgi:polyisoprenyl-teichoic acid--peptidoglycan teichoic acid transferase